jgi:hypothetical protein
MTPCTTCHSPRIEANLCAGICPTCKYAEAVKAAAKAGRTL